MLSHMHARIRKYSYGYLKKAVSASVQAVSAINGPILFHILSKLFVYDRDKIWEKRYVRQKFYVSFWF